MEFEYYEAMKIPVYDSIAVYNGRKFGLVRGDSKTGYYLYEIGQGCDKVRLHLRVLQGTLMKLGVNEKKEFGIYCSDENGNDEDFMSVTRFIAG